MRNFIFFFAIVFFVSRLSAQTADELDMILVTPEVNFTQASRFVLVLAEVVDEKTEPAAAYTLALERGWLYGGNSAADFSDKSIKQGELCFLIMQAFNMPGSFLYTLFPSPRYAFRELDYLKLIPGRSDPSLKVSGEEMLRILGMIDAYRREKQLAVPPAPKPAVVAAEPLPEPPAAAIEPPAPEPPVAAIEPPAPEPPAVAAEPPVPEPPAVVAEPPVPEPPVAVVEPPAPEPAPVVVEPPVPEPPVAAAEPLPKPAVAAEPGLVRVGIIQFAPDMPVLPETEKSKLQEIARVLAQYPGRKVLVEGHAALAGDPEGRKHISLERAQGVADFLVSLKVRRPEEITVRAYGAARPVGDNNTAAGKAMNRRVEIIMLDEGQS
jgi:outer membrane protein OmpA-like peptidoglycan-associated protein